MHFWECQRVMLAPLAFLIFFIIKQCLSDPIDYSSRRTASEDQRGAHQRIYSQYSGVKIQETPKPQPNPAEKIFRTYETCVEKCAIQCQPIGEDDELELFFYLCRQIRRPERTLKDRLLKETSWPWLMFLIALGGSLVFCVICTCWSCCCRRVPSNPPRHNSINDLHIPHLEQDEIQTMPLRSGRNGALALRNNGLDLNGHIKRVADV